MTKPIVRSHVLAMTWLWKNRWTKRQMIDMTAKTFVDKEIYEALELLGEATGALEPPSRRNNTSGRSRDEAYAYDLYDKMQELDRAGTVPEIVVPFNQLLKCPVDTMVERDPTIVTRMERLEKAVMQVLENSVTPVTRGGGGGGGGGGAGRVQQVRPALPAVVVSSPQVGGGSSSFGPALERARSISRERERSASALTAPQEQGVVPTYADMTAGGVKRLRPGDTDQDGFRVPGRQPRPRKVVPRGTSTVDLSALGGAVAAPIDRYVGNTPQGTTKETVKQALMMCAGVLPGGSALEVLEVEQINSHLQHARTRAWKVTVPYGCREIMDNGAVYPPGWTHRAYFAPRQDRTKRARAGGEQERAPVASQEEVEEGMIDSMVEAARAKRESEEAAAAALRA